MSQEKVKKQNKAKVIELEERRKGLKFNIQQRFTLLAMMPAEGEYFNIRKMREVKEDLALNDKEQEVFESCTVLFPGGTVTNWKKANLEMPPKSVDVGEWLAGDFRMKLKKQFDEKKVRDDTVDLYDMFCGAPQG